MNQEHYITIAEAARMAPGMPSSNTVWRWARKGVKARNGERVRLAHTRYGGKLFTTADALTRFALRLAEADGVHFDDQQQQPLPSGPHQDHQRSSSKREREIEAAKERVRGLGML